MGRWGDLGEALVALVVCLGLLAGVMALTAVPWALGMVTMLGWLTGGAPP